MTDTGMETRAWRGGIARRTMWGAAAALLFGAAGLADLAMRASARPAWRTGALLAIVTALTMLWVQGAVGLIGAPDDPRNLLCGGVLLVVIAGTLLSRGAARGMALTMMLAALLQAAVAISPAGRGAVFVGGFAILWAAAGAAFAIAARKSR